MKKITLTLSFLAFIITAAVWGQGGSVRGNVYDKDTGEPIIFGTIYLQGTTIGANTDEVGFFSIGNIPPGDYQLVATYVGYDSVAMDITIRDATIVNRNLFMTTGEGINLQEAVISARKEKAKSDVKVSQITVTSAQIKALPSTGGQTDIAQYLTVLPGILSTGDQGGQIYIRGGSPVQNKILLDGMTIYNPFHSIGFFSVFETEIIRTVDVLTGGFNAEYGGRVSAIIDIKTREGNKKRLSGMASVNPFQAKALIEGPIKKMREGGSGSTSFLLTAKKSYINKTSPALYSYAVNEDLYQPAEGDTIGLGENVDALPFEFTDLYGKLSFVTENGSKFNVFGFNFTDKVDYVGVTKLDWDNVGGGANFTLIPPNSNLIIGGTFAFTDYKINLLEADGNPRSSSVTSYNALLDFSYFGLNSEVKYGFEINGFNTDFTFKNFIGNTIDQKSFTTELGAFIKFKYKLGNLILEPSFRAQIYASQNQTRPEPRLGVKWNVTENVRLKFAAGLYSQNLISSVNDLDVVNLFVGFLAGPEEQIFDPETGDIAKHRLQTATHGIFGVEVDLSKNLELNVEPYYKGFTQLIQVNRNKITPQDPNYTIETGDAYGIDFSLRYELNDIYLWGTYSLGYVNRDDAIQSYPTVYDRRHNVNLLGTYNFGANKDWEFAARWNMGSGFPFTLTQGFYQDFNLGDGITSDVLTENGDLGVILDEKRNDGRLPYYHRLDFSLKRTWKFSKYANLEAVVSVTNAYDRSNIFFFDRVRQSRVNQLPILPSLGLTFAF